MRRLTMHRKALAASAALALAAVGLGASSTPAGASVHHRPSLTTASPVTVVAQGLNNPRSLVWGPSNHLLVAEAGVAGTDCSGTSCFGLNGSVADISSGSPVRIVTGLASFADSGEIGGADGLVYANGHLSTLMTKSSFVIPNSLPSDLRVALYTQLGALLDVTGGHITLKTNPGDFDYVYSAIHENNPDGNPYSVIAGPNNGFYLVDAGANTLDSVDANGVPRVLAVMPKTPGGDGDAVPTCLAKGPDGALYISQLTAAGNTATAASVYRYVPSTGSMSVWATGFSAVTGCGFGASGDFYVTEFDTTGFPPSGPPAGAVVQISPNGTRTVLGTGKLFAPSGFLAGPDGSIYVSNNSTAAGSGGPVTGQVVKIG